MVLSSDAEADPHMVAVTDGEIETLRTALADAQTELLWDGVWVAVAQADALVDTERVARVDALGHPLGDDEIDCAPDAEMLDVGISEKLTVAVSLTLSLPDGADERVTTPGDPLAEVVVEDDAQPLVDAHTDGLMLNELQGDDDGDAVPLRAPAVAVTNRDAERAAVALASALTDSAPTDAVTVGDVLTETDGEDETDGERVGRAVTLGAADTDADAQIVGVDDEHGDDEGVEVAEWQTVVDGVPVSVEQEDAVVDSHALLLRVVVPDNDAQVDTLGDALSVDTKPPPPGDRVIADVDEALCEPLRDCDSVAVGEVERDAQLLGEPDAVEFRDPLDDAVVVGERVGERVKDGDAVFDTVAQPDSDDDVESVEVTQAEGLVVAL